jgi:AbrB family looped-hinge helix DNA binding protein
MSAVSVTSKGQVTIPKRVRQALGITPGSKVEFDIDRGGARLKLVKSHSVSRIEDEEQVETALRLSRKGIDFTDALHHAASAHCREMVTFDDRRFAGRAAKLGLKPRVIVLSR